MAGTSVALKRNKQAKVAKAVVAAGLAKRNRRNRTLFPTRSYQAFEQPISLTRATNQGLPRTSRGLVIADPNPDLHPYLARGIQDDLGVYSEMSRSDPILAGILGLITRTVSAAQWTIKEPDQPTADEAKALMLVKKLLGFDGLKPWLRGGWARHLALAVWDKMAYGFRPFEVVWSSRQWDDETLLIPDRLYAIPTSTVWGWIWSDIGDLAGMVQTSPVLLRGYETVTAGQKRLSSLSSVPVLGRPVVALDSSRILLYIHNGDVDQNPEGISAMRPTWVYWQAKKDTLLRYQEGQENLIDGLTTISEVANPTTGLPYDSDSESDLEMFDQSLIQWAEGLLRYLYVPLGYEMKAEHPAFSMPSPRDSLEYFDTQIAASFNSQLMGIPSPSATLSGTSAALTYSSIDAIARGCAEVFNGQPEVATSGIIQRMVDVNIPGAAENPRFRYPSVEPVGIKHQDPKSYFDAITKAAQFRMLHYTPEVEQIMRRAADLPDLTAEEMELRRQWARARLEAEAISADVRPETPDAEDEESQERMSEEDTQDAVEPPEQDSVIDPDGV